MQARLTFAEVLRLARANTAGLQWWEGMNGYITCEDGRDPLEAAAGVTAGEYDRAIDVLFPGAPWIPGLVRDVHHAAAHRVCLADLPTSERGALMLALQVAHVMPERQRRELPVLCTGPIAPRIRRVGRLESIRGRRTATYESGDLRACQHGRSTRRESA